MNNIKPFSLTGLLSKFGLDTTYAFSETTSWIQKLDAHKQWNTQKIIDLAIEMATGGVRGFGIRTTTINLKTHERSIQNLLEKIEIFEGKVKNDNKSWRSSLEGIEAFQNSCQKDLVEIERDIEVLAEEMNYRVSSVGINGPVESLVKILICKFNDLVNACQDQVENAISELMEVKRNDSS